MVVVMIMEIILPGSGNNALICWTVDRNDDNDGQAALYEAGMIDKKSFFR
jgi:hypothetical protein